MRQGFILIEIMIASVIAGLLATGLLSTIMQVNQLQQTINTITSIDGRLAILQQQLERDIMGAFVPTQVDLIQTQTGKKEESRKPLDQIFEGISKGKGERLDYLTFITSNPLEIFFGIKKIALKPRVARVVYRLIPDARRKNSYLLTRQEGTTKLALNYYKPEAEGEFRAYPMIDGIQDVSVQFVTVEEHKEKDSKKVKYVYKKSSTWRSQQKDKDKKETDQKRKKPPRLPNFVEFHISLWDSLYENYREFNITIPIETRAGEFEIPPKKKEEEKKKEEAKKPAKPVGKAS